MSENKEEKPVIRPIPENLPEELLPLYDWWQANGARAIAVAVIAALIAAGVFGFRQYYNNQITGANLALTQSQGIEELETALAQYGMFKPANALRLRLAKAYFDGGRYADAVSAYQDCIAKGAPKGFEDQAALGLACALEGDKQYEAALAAFRDFQKNRAESLLIADAEFGEARTLSLMGKKDEALKLLATFEEKAKDDADAKVRVASWKALIERYVPRAEVSLFDKADAAATEIAVPEVAPAVEKLAEMAAPVAEKPVADVAKEAAPVADTK